MPNKTIYVADADLAVFERAQELAGENLSATIAQALRRFVEVEEARSRGFDLVTLKVGKRGMQTSKQFLGRELAKQHVRDENQPRITTAVVFQTAKGRFVHYVRTSPDWTAWASSWNQNWDYDWNVDWSNWPQQPAWPHFPRHMRDAKQHHQWDWSNWASGSEYTMEVYDTLDELKPHVSDEMYAAVEHALRGEDVEFLDI